MQVRLAAALLLLTPALFAADSAAPIAPSSAFIESAQQKKLPEAPSHSFLDRENVALHAANLALITGDMISTRLIVDGGGREQNPIARPFVNSGIGGQMAASYALGFGGTLLGSYWLHRSGHHRLERILPISVMAIEAYATASNAHLLAGGHLVHYYKPR